MVTFPHAAFKTGPTDRGAGEGTVDCGIALFGRKTSVRPEDDGTNGRSAGDLVLLYLFGPERILSKLNVLSMVSQLLLNFLSISMGTQDFINLLSIKYQPSIKGSVFSLQNLN